MSQNVTKVLFIFKLIKRIYISDKIKFIEYLEEKYLLNLLFLHYHILKLIKIIIMNFK